MALGSADRPGGGGGANPGSRFVEGDVEAFNELEPGQSVRRPFSARGRPPASAHPPASSPEIPAPLVGESHVVSLGPLYESPFHPQGSAQRHQGPPAMRMVGTCCALSSLPGGERLVRRFRWEDGNAERAAKSCEELRSLWSLWSCELGALQRTLKLADFGLVPPLRAPPLRSAPLPKLSSPLFFWFMGKVRGPGASAAAAFGAFCRGRVHHPQRWSADSRRDALPSFCLPPPFFAALRSFSPGPRVEILHGPALTRKFDLRKTSAKNRRRPRCWPGKAMASQPTLGMQRKSASFRSGSC